MKVERKATLHYDLDVQTDADHFNAVNNLQNTYNAISGFKLALGDSIKTELKKIDSELLKPVKIGGSKAEEINPKVLELLDKAVELISSRYQQIFLMNGVKV